MAIWAIVPVKPLRRGKSRLAEVLTEQERTALNKNLLVHTLETLAGIQDLTEVLVISRDQKTLAIARSIGVRTLLEDGAQELNLALTRATVFATTYGARQILILPADLPQLAEEDVLTMLDKGRMPSSMIIAPDHRQQGTNGLLLNPAGSITYHFGEGSFQKHLAEAESKQFTSHICQLPALARDVDLPEDLSFLTGEAAQWFQPWEFEEEVVAEGKQD